MQKGSFCRRPRHIQNSQTMSNTLINIRPAQAEDSQFIADMVRELAIYEKLEHECLINAGKVRQALFAATPQAYALIAEYQGQPAGFALYFYNFSTFLTKRGIYLEDLYVRSQHRGQGLGLALLKRLAQIAHEQNCERLEWCVLNWNTSAINFYKSLGAQGMDEWTTYRLSRDGIAQLLEHEASSNAN